MSPAVAARRTRNRSTWAEWSAYLATIPADYGQGSRDRWQSAYAAAAAVLPDTDPMWGYHPHDWTARDIIIHTDARAAAAIRGAR